MIWTEDKHAVRMQVIRDIVDRIERLDSLTDNRQFEMAKAKIIKVYNEDLIKLDDRIDLIQFMDLRKAYLKGRDDRKMRQLELTQSLPDGLVVGSRWSRKSTGQLVEVTKLTTPKRKPAMVHYTIVSPISRNTKGVFTLQTWADYFKPYEPPVSQASSCI